MCHFLAPLGQPEKMHENFMCSLGIPVLPCALPMKFCGRKEETNMLTSLALIFLVGLSMAAIVQQLKLPRIIGMLITGIVVGPYVLNWLDPSILSISAELRQMALIIILLKAGLSLNLSDLKKVGRPAVMMSFVPASFEILGYVLVAPHLLGVNIMEAAVMGAVLGAVSPAVVVPRMVQLMETGYGTKKGIPQMILAGASCDDIFSRPPMPTSTVCATAPRSSSFWACPSPSWQWRPGWRASCRSPVCWLW